MYGLNIITEPTIEPVTAEQCKSHLRIDASDSDVELAGVFLPAARQEAERYTGRAMINTTVDLSLPSFPSIIRLPLGKTSSVTSVKYYDADEAEQTIDSGNYYTAMATEPAMLMTIPSYSWPTCSERPLPITVRYVVGYGSTRASVPYGLQLAIMMLAAHRYQHRGDDSTRAKWEWLTPKPIYHLLDQYRVGDDFTDYLGLETSWRVA